MPDSGRPEQPGDANGYEQGRSFTRGSVPLRTSPVLHPELKVRERLAKNSSRIHWLLIHTLG
jgi:hypothetical protein